MIMRRAVLATIAALSCQQTNGLPEQASGETIVVKLTSGNAGTAQNPAPINFDPSNAYAFHIEMHRPDGTIDTDFNSFIRISSKPGTVYAVNGGQYGRNVLMNQGVADNVQVTIVAAFGETRVWADDVGYVPVDLTRSTPPKCADNIDNNNNGLIDYPADPGCYAPNDDTEDAGTGATGASDVIFYALPRIADVRGGPTNGGTRTAFPNEQVTIDTGYDLQSNTFKWDTIVTGLASDGFFVTDLQDGPNDPQANLGYSSVYAYTFSAPTKIGVCDRLRLFQGTSSDFYGYTELNFPTWAVEYWNPAQRPCLVPDAVILGTADWGNAALMFRNESALVRLASQPAVGTLPAITLHVGKTFGAGHPTYQGVDPKTGLPLYTPTCDANGCYSNCDLSGHGKVDYSDPADNACATACTADPECTEFSGYLSNGGFTIVMNEGSAITKTQGDAVAATSFDPVASAGKQIGAFTGVLRYFSGGSQFTIQARCPDDVIADPNGTPFDSAHACVNQNGNNPEQQL